MKNLPLTVQIWLLSIIVTLFASGLIIIFLPGMLQQFFTQQVLSILEDSQKNIQVQTINVETMTADAMISTEQDPSIPSSETVPVDNSSIVISITSASDSTESSSVGVEGQITIKEAALATSALPFMNHIYFSAAHPLPEPQLEEAFRKQVMSDASRQRETTEKYTTVKDGKTLLYVIRKTTTDGKPGILLSYAWGTYRNDMAGSLYRQLMLLMLAAIALSWIPSLLVSRHLTRPLVKMENHFLKLGDKDWDEPLALDRKDEIGRLASAFEDMRERLQRQDQAQQVYLQNISHSLKTPIMVIQSYSKAILDGIYPKGDLNKSLLTIKNEADRTNKLVQDILMLNKIKYLSTRDMKMEPVFFECLIDEIADKFSTRRPELQWKVQLADFTISGDPDQWQVVIENLLDNATRYAITTIEIELNDDPFREWWLRIWNDGNTIEETYLDKLFEEYYTGKGGQSGLGLAIVSHIVELHHGKVWARNENGGAAFYLSDARILPGRNMQG